MQVLLEIFWKQTKKPYQSGIIVDKDPIPALPQTSLPKAILVVGSRVIKTNGNQMGEKKFPKKDGALQKKKMLRC